MSVSLIRTLSLETGVLTMTATCLGIGTGFGPYLRSDCPYDGVYLDYPDEDDEEDDSSPVVEDT